MSTSSYVKYMNETQNDVLGYYPKDFQTSQNNVPQQNSTPNLFGQNELLSMLFSGKIKNPLESNPLFNAISSIQKMKPPQETEKSIDDDFFEEY